MSLDFFAIASQGVYPTPTPTDARRAALAVSQGLLNITLPDPPDIEPSFISWGIEAWGRVSWGIRKWGGNG